MTRIVAGAAKGRRLAVPASARPTSDRAREGLLASIMAIRGTLAGGRVLDLYAGSGAVGLEALSRGAADVIMVEADLGAARVIRQNIEAVALPGARLLTSRVDRILARGPGSEAPRDFVFADPPYAASADEVAWMLRELAGRGWLAPGAVIVVERASRAGPPDWPPGYRPDRVRKYGEATLWYGLAAGEEPGTASSGGE